MVMGYALNLGHRWADYVVTWLVLRNGTRLARCACLMSCIWSLKPVKLTAVLDTVN